MNWSLPRALRGLTAKVLVLCFLVGSAAAQAQQITVSAASSLSEALREIGARFESGRPGARVRFNFAASGVLIQQILHGAPADVFVSADQDTLDRGVEQKVLEGATRRDFARNALVMIAPAQDAPTLTQLADLGRPEVRRVAIGKPAAVPAGRYARQALQSVRLWDGVEPKLVFADNVRQVLDYVARGEVAAGFVYRTDAALMKDRVRVVATVGGHAPITYPAVVVVGSRQPALARDFHAFLFTPDAQAVLARHGFGRP